jgi:2-polyprenyl-6-methoxyphenol hydroxylase-like FAD-dependent oxidoreductase
VIERALVVGGGPAGMTAAIALAQRGVDVEVVELDPSWRAEGVGLTLQNSPLRALKALGLLHACVEAGYPHRRVNMCAADGTPFHVVESQPLTDPADPPMVAIARSAFHQLLQQALRTTGVPVRLGTTLARIEQEGDRVEVELGDGTRGRYDLVVGADGLHSSVRDLVFENADELRPVYAGQIIWRAELRRPRELTEYVFLHRRYEKVGLVPISERSLYLFMVQTVADPARPPREDFSGRLRDNLSGFGGFVPELAEQISAATTIDFRELQTLLVPPPWFRDRTVLIGDAAHTTTPHLAFGVGIAIEDAIVLAELVGSGLTSAQLLAAFMERRFERCRLVVENSLQLSRWEQNPDAPDADPSRLTAESFRALAQPF